MSSYRPSRVGEQIKKEVSQILNEELKDPRLGFITVTEVDVTNDLQHAKIFVSIFGDEEKEKENIKVLEKATGFIRNEIGRRIRLRFVPTVTFKVDKSLDKGERIDELLSRVRKGEEKP